MFTHGLKRDNKKHPSTLQKLSTVEFWHLLQAVMPCLYLFCCSVLSNGRWPTAQVSSAAQR